MASVKEPELLVAASVVQHLVECFREAHLHSPQGEYGTTSEMYNDLLERANKKMVEFDRKTWRN